MRLPVVGPNGVQMPPLPPSLSAPAPVGPLTMAAAVRIALRRNPQVLSAAKQVEVQQALLHADGATYYPQVSATGSYQHSAANHQTLQTAGAFGGTTSVVVVSTQDTMNTQLNVNQTIYDFDRRRFKLMADAQSLESVRQNLVLARLDVALAVRQAYLTVALDQALVVVNKQTVADQQEHLRQALGFYEIGTKARNEVTQARANLAQAQLNLIRAQGTLRAAWVSLNVAMGIAKDVTYRITVVPGEQLMLTLDRARLIAVAWARRPDLRALLAQMRSTLANFAYDHANRLPTLSFGASYGWSGFPSPLEQFWSVGTTLSWTLFDGGADHFAAEAARAQAASYACQIEQLRQQIYQQVESDFIKFEQGKAEVVAARISLENAEENYRIASERYQVGLGANVDYIDAQAQEAQARSDMATAESDLRTAKAQLEHDVGVSEITQLPPPAPPVRPDRVPDASRRAPEVTSPPPRSSRGASAPNGPTGRSERPETSPSPVKGSPLDERDH